MPRCECHYQMSKSRIRVASNYIFHSSVHAFLCFALPISSLPLSAHASPLRPLLPFTSTLLPSASLVFRFPVNCAQYLTRTVYSRRPCHVLSDSCSITREERITIYFNTWATRDVDVDICVSSAILRGPKFN